MTKEPVEFDLFQEREARPAPKALPAEKRESAWRNLVRWLAKNPVKSEHRQP